jgi:hypothetical protein
MIRSAANDTIREIFENIYLGLFLMGEDSESHTFFAWRLTRKAYARLFRSSRYLHLAEESDLHLIIGKFQILLLCRMQTDVWFTPNYSKTIGFNVGT